MKDTDKAFADVDLSIYPVSWSKCIEKMTRNGSCSEFELEQTTDDFLATVRKYRDQGYPEDELATKLRDAANDMEGYCPVCVSKLDRERETLD